MSQTVTAPADTGLDGWFTSIKAAFGFGPSAAVAAPQELPSRSRVATLAKTFANVRLQPPEQAMRPMQEIASELTVAELTLAESGGALTAPAAQLKLLVDNELTQLGAKAEAIAATHVKAWRADVAKLPAAGADATAKAKSDRALAIQQLLAEIEPGVARDSYMLRQVAAPTTALDALGQTVADLKAEYKTLLPQRTTEGDPKALPQASKPQIAGALTGEEHGQLDKSLKDTQALMAKEGAPDLEVVGKAVELIGKGIDARSAKEHLTRLKTWEAVKKHYHALAETSPDEAKAFMAQMWWYRRMTVDAVMAKMQKDYGCIWGSVGSDNPESDYDLTVRTHGKKAGGSGKSEIVWDYQIVQEVNGLLGKDFGGAPPGILFDTNLYAEAAAPPQELSEDQKKDPTIQAMGAMKEQGQDVGALMKLRRYMDWDQYEDYKAKMLDGVADKADRALVERQFAEANSLYFVARAEQLKQAAAQDPDKEAGKAAIAEIELIPLTPAGQKRLLQLADALEHDGAKSMAANNAIYVEKVAEARKLEAQYTAEPDPKKKAALLARLKTYQADATFFAAEAYHSEGPLQHVVKAGQSSKLEIEGDGKTYTASEKAAAIEKRKQEKLAALSPNQMLQSFNENLGDLLKDLRHYASEPFPGLGFYRSSKYIERLCDAFGIIAPKLPEASQRGFKALTIAGKSPAAVQTAVAGLVDIRGEKKGFPPGDGAPADPEAEKQAYAIAEMNKILPGVTTLPDLAKVMTDFGQRVNSLVRSAITADMRALDENPYFPKQKE